MTLSSGRRSDVNEGVAIHQDQGHLIWQPRMGHACDRAGRVLLRS